MLLLSACGGESGVQANQANQADANQISEDPFGATGAPGADMTDNGVTDGGSDLPSDNGSSNTADTNAGQ
jgi:hypothetical protein